MRLFILLCLFALFAAPACAQSVIRDAEIESDLRAIATPIFDAAGLNPSQVRIILINDDTVNAFVAEGQNLFLYSGLILEAKNVSELGGVVAHEAGHMAGGHLIRMRDAYERASIENMVASLAGIAIGVGAGDANAGLATAVGGGQYAMRSMLRHSRTLESSADQSGMATLERAGLSSQGMADFLQNLAGQEALPEMQRSPYVLTHPLSRDRLDAVNSFLTHSKNNNKTWPADWENKFHRMQAKLLAFTQPARAERLYATQSNSDAFYATAIAAYRQGRIPEALDKINVMLKTDADNPYLYELRGQILFEQGRIPDAITAYQKSVDLQPRSGLLHLALAQAMLQRQNAPTADAIDHLLKAQAYGERDTSLVYRWLAVAYGRAGQEGKAKLALAEEALLKRDANFAITQSKQAEILLAGDPAAQQRARDLNAAAERLKEKKKKDKDK